MTTRMESERTTPGNSVAYDWEMRLVRQVAAARIFIARSIAV